MKQSTQPDALTESVTEALRSAVQRSGLSAWKLAQLSGVNEHVVRRFLAQDCRIRSDTLDQLCVALGLRLVDPGASSR